MPVVRPNPNQFQVMDFGRAAMQGMSIRSAQQRNEALGMELEQQKDMLRNRKRAQEIRQQFQETPDQIDELNRAGLFDLADEVRSNYLAQAKTEVDLIKGMRTGIDEENYTQVRQELIGVGAITPEMWPDEYSDDWFNEQEKSSKSALTKLTRRWAEEGAIMTQDFVQRDGEIIWEGAPFEEPGKQPKGRGADFEFKASDANALSRQTERMFGTYDPETGRFAFLDRQQSLKIAAVQEEAERLYKENQGQITHGQAMAQAARKSGIVVENLQQQQNLNPLNLQRIPGTK